MCRVSFREKPRDSLIHRPQEGGRNYTAVSVLHGVTVVDLNADVGEWDSGPPSSEVELMRFISSANIACGVHAGNSCVMLNTVELAAAHGVAIGAHPSFDDRDHFGRREMTVSTVEVERLISLQLETLASIAARLKVRIRHVKPHGALYNMSARDRSLADAVAAAVAAFDPKLVLYGLAGSESITAGRAAGLRTASETFADRAYLADGSLAPRSAPGAVIEDADVVATRAVRMAREQSVVALDGTAVHVTAETICVHGDTPAAATLTRRVRQALEAAGVQISAIR